MPETTLQTPWGQLTLERPHSLPSSPLRAWSAADELILAEVAQGASGRLLIINDEFGALTCALASAAPNVWVDSALSRSAIEANLAANGFAGLPVSRQVRGDEFPTGQFDTVLIRVPKTLALLEHQLAVVSTLVGPDAQVIGTGMVKHIHSSTVAAFERLIGPTTTSRATRKARLITSTPGPTTAAPAELQRSSFVFDGLIISELPGTFSAGHVDVGTALLIEELAKVPAPEAGATVADLGCGNGIVAAALARDWPGTELCLVDASDMAAHAAGQTMRNNGFDARSHVHAADGFTGVLDDDAVDVVVTNPPFHQGHALDSGLTAHVLTEAARVLRNDGAAYVVAQRHLKLHTTLRRWFGRVEAISKHPSHVVIEAGAPR